MIILRRILRGLARRSVVVAARRYGCDGAADGASPAASGVADRHRLATGVGDVRGRQPAAGVSGAGGSVHDRVRPADLAGVARIADGAYAGLDCIVIRHVLDTWAPLRSLAGVVAERESVERSYVVGALYRLERWQYVDVEQFSVGDGSVISYVRLHRHSELE